MEQRSHARFGDLLKQHRTAASLTQEELAERAGVSVRAIMYLERGARRPRPPTVRLLALALALSPEEQAALVRATRTLAGDGAAGLPESPPLDIDTPTAHPFAVTTQPAPFVGRGRDMQLMERHLEGAGPPLLILAGEPGIGKTRLLQEATRRASVCGFQVLAGGCQRRGGQEPYAPLLEALERHLHGQPTTQRQAALEGCAWLTRLLPELAEAGMAPLPLWTLAAEQERRLMFKAVARLLTNVAGQAGTLLVLDDLQWAGADALDLLASLARAAPTARLRVIGAYRDTEVRPEDPLALLLADLAHAGLATHQALAPLAAAEAALLLEGLLEGTAASGDALRAEVLRRTGGVPFFLVSCAQTLRLRDRDGGSDDAVPWDVAQGVRQRVAALPAAARELVGAAAVVGRIVPRPLLESVVAGPEADLLTALAAACRARLLEESGDDAYQFAHDVIHEVVRADLGAAQRASLHRRVGEALERTSGEPAVELLAYHYGRAGEHERAITYLVRAAERARVRAAYREVVALLAQAITLAERLGRRDRAAELRAMRGKAFISGEMWTQAREELEAALEGLAPEHMERRAEALIDLAVACWWILDYATGGRYASEAFALAEAAGRHDLAAAAIAYIAQVDKCEGRMAQSLAIFRRGLALPGGERNPGLLEPVPLVHYLLGHIDDAIRFGREAVATIRESKDARLTVIALTHLGVALGADGRYDEAMRLFEEARQFARDYELRTMLARASSFSTGLHLDVFDFPGAEARGWEAYELARSANWSPPAVSAGIDLLFTFVRSSDLGRAETFVDEVVRLSKLPGSFHEWLWRIRLTQARGELALARGDWEQARHLINQSLKQCRISGRLKYEVIGLGTRARASLAAGHGKEALVDLRRAVKLAQRLGDPAQFIRVAAALLALDGDDLLAAEARATADRIVAALPDEAMRRRFRDAEVVRGLGLR